MKWVILFLLMLPLASASYITMQTSITPSSSEVIVNVTNFGDEPAHNVQLSLDVDGNNYISDEVKQLGIEENFGWRVPLKSEVENPGKYPVILTTNYHDANLYPFSSISVTTFDFQQSTLSNILSNIDNVDLSQKGKLIVNIKNNDVRNRNFKVRIIVPKELTIEDDEIDVNIKGKSEKTFKLDLKRFSALVGSSYVVFAVIEYNDNGRHYTSIGRGVVNVVEGNDFGISLNYLVISLVLLILLFIFFQVKYGNKFFK